MSQKEIATLFGVDVRTVNEHLRNIFRSGELSEEATIRNFRIVRSEGNREVSREIAHYDLDAIISVGYRVSCVEATQFRVWATTTLRAFMQKGFVLDDERLKLNRRFGRDYFDELLERIREIRASERRFYLNGAPTPSVSHQGRIYWLTNIPRHWEVVPSKWLFGESKERAQRGDQQLSATQAYGVIPQSEFERLEGRQVVHSFLHQEKRKHVELDDFVVSMRSFQGGLERAWAPGCIRSSYVVLRPSAAADPSFFQYLFKSTGYIQALQATSNFIRDGQDLNFKNFTLVNLPRVPVDQQRAIADFLDRKTAAIDALIKKKQKLLDLLAEKRAALINQAVTKGLDPNVPTKYPFTGCAA